MTARPCPAYIVLPDGTRRYCQIDHLAPEDSTHVGDRTEAEFKALRRAWRAQQKDAR